MNIFIDFETEGLNGKIIEICARSEDNSIIVNEKNPDYKTQISIFQKLFQKENIIVFWHPWMLKYLSTNYIKTISRLDLRCLIFMNIYNFIKDENKEYSIQSATKDLINKEHIGTAYQDSEDLLMCYKKLKEKLHEKK